MIFWSQSKLNLFAKRDFFLVVVVVVALNVRYMFSKTDRKIFLNFFLSMKEMIDKSLSLFSVDLSYFVLIRLYGD